MSTEQHYLINVYKNDCALCEENAVALAEAASLDERISVHDIDFNTDTKEFKTWLKKNSITDAPALVAMKNSVILSIVYGQGVSAQEILDLFPEEKSS